MEETTTKKSVGFASMPQAQRRAIASLGGKQAHALGKAHQYTVDEARAAGRKGGRVVSADREHMAAIGRAGGNRSRKQAAAKKQAADVSQDNTNG